MLASPVMQEWLPGWGSNPSGFRKACEQKLFKSVPDAGQVVISSWICGLIKIAVPENKESVLMVIPRKLSHQPDLNPRRMLPSISVWTKGMTTPSANPPVIG
jgi:hypothetical protein